MPVPTLPTAITLADIQTEFGGSNPIDISEYYAGVGVPANTANATGVLIPSSGAINFSNFSGASGFGSYAYLTNGTYTFTVPAGVTQINICGVAAGGGGVRRSNAPRGGGGAGGALITVNNVAVQAAQTIWVSVGAGGTGGNQVTAGTGGNTEVRYTNSTGTLIFSAGGGTGAGTTSASVAGGLRANGSISGTFNGGNGGAGGEGNNGSVGGGGAGGYTGNGGNNGNGTTTQTAGSAGAGGGGGGAGAAGGTGSQHMPTGGAVSPFGSGGDGAAGTLTTNIGAAGGGGSGGPDNKNGELNAAGSASAFWMSGSAYHWGAGGGGSSSTTNIAAGAGGRGACVITYGPNSTWPNPSFPVDTGDYRYVSRIRVNVDAVASLTFYSANGVAAAVGSTTTTWNWLVSGVNTDYEIRVQSLATAGTGTTGGTLNSWLALTSDREWTRTATISGLQLGVVRLLVEIRQVNMADKVYHASVLDLFAQADAL